MMDELSGLTGQIVDAGLTVHKALGSGLLENAYERCLARELQDRGIETQAQVGLPLSYKGLKLDAGYRIDLLVAGTVIVELKSVEAILPIHEAQILTYLKLSGLKIGFLMNFNVVLFKNGLRRFVATK